MIINKRLIGLGQAWVNQYFELTHHGVKGQKWGVKNGPPYPIKRNGNAMFIKSSVRNEVEKALKSGKIKLKINRGNQLKHTKSNHLEGRSYLYGDLDYAQDLINKLNGTGKVVVHESKGWVNKELVVADHIIGCSSGKDTKKAMIIYSKKGSHIIPKG